MLEEVAVDQTARDRWAEQFAALVRGEAMQLEFSAQPLPQHGDEHPVKLRSGNQLLLAGSEVGEVADEIEAERVNVLQVAEDDEHGLAAAKVGEQLDDLR